MRAIGCWRMRRERAGARHVLTAHTLDDQAETVLIRLTRGSGISGLAAMARIAPLPGGDGDGRIALVRPLLEVPKARLLATLRKAGIAYADDPSNRDPRFTRVRLRDGDAGARTRGPQGGAAGVAGAPGAAGRMQHSRRAVDAACALQGPTVAGAASDRAAR